jgi:hypothetical protein
MQREPAHDAAEDLVADRGHCPSSPGARWCALPDLGLGARVDEERQLALAEQVDEPRGDQVVVRVEAELGGNVPQVAHPDDAISPDAHVGAEPRAARAVHDPARAR